MTHDMPGDVRPWGAENTALVRLGKRGTAMNTCPHWGGCPTHFACERRIRKTWFCIRCQKSKAINRWCLGCQKSQAVLSNSEGK